MFKLLVLVIIIENVSGIVHFIYVVCACTYPHTYIYMYERERNIDIQVNSSSGHHNCLYKVLLQSI